MKKRISFTCYLVAALVISTASTSHADVNYHAQGKWGGKCLAGKKQSPIAIDPATKPSSSSDIKFHGYDSFDWTPYVAHAPIWEAKVASTPAPYFEVTVAGKKRKYQLERLHFHSPAEHLIGKKRPVDDRVAMELHMVHKRVDENSNDYAVVAILFKKGDKKSATLEQYLKVATTERTPATLPTIGLRGMLPANSAYYEYDGSLTTPTCDEIVKWFVLARTATVTQAQIDAFTKHVRTTPTNRDLQNLNGRPVLYHP